MWEIIKYLAGLVISLILFVAPCDKKPKSHFSPPNPGLQKLAIVLDMLDIAADAVKIIDNDKGKIQLPICKDKAYADFSVFEFADKHNIKNKEDFINHEKNVRIHIRECTDEALNSEDANFNKQLEMRSLCLEKKGYDKNDAVLYQNKKWIAPNTLCLKNNKHEFLVSTSERRALKCSK